MTFNLDDYLSDNSEYITTELEKVRGDIEILFKTTDLTHLLDKLYFAGGAIRDLYLKEKPKDWDVFINVPNEEKASLIEELKTKLEGRINFISDNALAILTNVQIIICETGIPFDMVNSFDFTMNSNFYTFDNKHLYIKDRNAIKQKKLVFNNRCRNAAGTLARVPKFVSRGWEIPSKCEMLKIATILSKMKTIDSLTALDESSRIYLNEEDLDDIGAWEFDYFTYDRVGFTSKRAGSGA